MPSLQVDFVIVLQSAAIMYVCRQGAVDFVAKHIDTQSQPPLAVVHTCSVIL